MLVIGARKAGVAVWFKQFGDWINNPLYLKHKALAPSAKHIDLVGKAIGAGERQAFIEYPPGRSPIIGGEKGGATLDGEVLHEMPPLYHKMSESLNKPEHARRSAIGPGTRCRCLFFAREDETQIAHGRARLLAGASPASAPRWCRPSIRAMQAADRAVDELVMAARSTDGRGADAGEHP